MEFGKTPKYKEIQYLYYPNDERNNHIFQYPQNEQKIFYGAPLWAQASWRGTWYRKDAKPVDYLREYAKIFNSIELNSSFYHCPTEAQILKWKKEVPTSFKFCPKFPKNISHFYLKSLSPSFRIEIDHFKSALKLFGENLGHPFLQLPQEYSIGYINQLSSFIKNHKDLPSFFIEFRHHSWFYKNTLRPEVFQLLHENNIGAVITDVAGRQDLCHTSCPSAKTMVRFIGNDHKPTDQKRVEFWTTRLCDLLSSGLKSSYFFGHQPNNDMGPELIDYFLKSFSSKAELSAPLGIPKIEQSQQSLI